MVTVDSRWSWVVCLSALSSHFLTIGFTFSVSVYYAEFLSVFQYSKGSTGWITGVHYGIIAVAGPIGSLCIHRWGIRITMFIGGIVAALGLLICSFATNFYLVLFSFGLLTGFGSGLAYAAAIVVVSVYFDRYRPLALGLSLAGGGLGNICFPWISSALIETYGWRGALLISSGLLLNMCAGAMLIFNENPTERKQDFSENETKKSKDSEIEKSLPSQIYYIQTEGKSVSIVQVDYENQAFENDKIDNKYSQGKDHNPGTSAQLETSKKQEKDDEDVKLSVREQNRELFGNPSFCLLLLSITLFLFAAGSVFTHVLSYVESQGVPHTQGTSIVSVMGGTAFAGRLGLGGLSNIPCTNTIIIYVAAMLINGSSAVAMAVFRSTVGLRVSSGLYGFFVAAFGPTISECTYLVAGPKLFNIGHGYIMVGMGTGWLLGAPAAGILYDYTDYYPYSFHLAGGVAILGALITIPVIFLQRKINGNETKGAKNELK